MANKTNAENQRACAERVVPVPTGIDESGDPIVIQPPTGIGCRMAPEKYQNIVKDLSAGMSILDVAERHGIGPSTVHLLRKRHDDICPGHRKVMNQRMEEMKEQLMESMAGDLESGRMPRGVKPVAFGIIADKHAVSEGNVVRHQHLHAIVPSSEVNSMLSGLSGAGKDKESSVSDQNTQKNSPFVDIDPNIAQNNTPPSPKTKGGEGGAAPEPGQSPTD